MCKHTHARTYTYTHGRTDAPTHTTHLLTLIFASPKVSELGVAVLVQQHVGALDVQAHTKARARTNARAHAHRPNIHRPLS